MEYLIRFPVGDWSDDGHGKCDYFMVRSNKLAQEVREIHFSCPERLGFDIGNICREYEDSDLSLEIFDKLQAAGFDIEWEDAKSDNQKMCRYFHSSDSRAMGTEEVFHLWIDILQFLDSELELKLEIVEYEDINFYGVDKKKRHLSTPGYGVWY